MKVRMDYGKIYATTFWAKSMERGRKTAHSARRCNLTVLFRKRFCRQRDDLYLSSGDVRLVLRSYIMITDGVFFGHLNLVEGCDTI